MARRGDGGKCFNISVVGLSGTERDKGQLGVGKSCLCNRFVRPKADDYFTEHISVLSQSDFSGRVINNDHFLYWGEIRRVSEDGVEFHFQVVEQTEFVDDSSFQPFKGGKMEPYVKRCSNTKLQSAEKLMYICKNQLGIEKEYEQKVIPDGRFNVDGFLCLVDVSVVPSRPIERQLDFIAHTLQNLMKTKKPVVVVTTKNDEACDAFVREVERFINRKDFKGNIPIVETSAHENVNVDLAFVILAQLIDKTKGRTRIVPYSEAYRSRKELADSATEAYMRLVRMHVQDYRTPWSHASKKLSLQQDYIFFVDNFGQDDAKRLFMKHVKRLKDEHLARKVKGYTDSLPDVLMDLYPDIPSLGDGDWERIKEEIHQHPDFEHYFIDCPADATWMDLDLLESTENRIPFNVLELQEAESVYRSHVNMLQREQRLAVYRKEFKQLLEETGYVTPGKHLSEVQVLFMGRECFEALLESDCQKIYDQHQKEIIERSKSNFQELLFEYADVFYQFSSITVTAEDIREIRERLQEDSRFKALDRLDGERQKLLLQHLSFVQYPRRENCVAFPHCCDTIIENTLRSKSSSDSSSLKKQQQKNWLNSQDFGQLSVTIVGDSTLAQEVVREVKGLCDDDEYELNGQVHTFQFEILDGDAKHGQTALRFSGFVSNGCFCIYSSIDSLNSVREVLEKNFLSSIDGGESVTLQGVPIVLLLVANPTLSDNEVEHLRSEGMNLAETLQCTFFDLSDEPNSDGTLSLRSSEFSHALRTLITAIQQKSGLVSIYQSLSEVSDPDIRIIMCLLCGDPFSIDTVILPLLSNPSCVVTGDRTVILETFLGDCRRKVEVTISSYHAASEYRESLIHGYILVYSTKRRASLAVLNAFSAATPDVPIQILAVTETGGISVIFNSELSHQLITLGNSIADRLQAHFMTLTPSSSQKTVLYTPFFRDVWDKKPEVEKAYHLDDSGLLHDSGEGTLERPPRPPLPPPRNDSRALGSNDGSRSGSEIYERLPTDGSLGDGLEEGCSPTFQKSTRRLIASDDSDVYSTLDRDGEKRGSEKFNGELLMKPSHVKAKRGQPESQFIPEMYPTSPSSFTSKQCMHSNPGTPPTQLSTPPPELDHAPKRDGGFRCAFSTHHSKFVHFPRIALLLGTNPLTWDRETDQKDPGGFQVFPQPSTPPEPAPPDRGTRLVSDRSATNSRWLAPETGQASSFDDTSALASVLRDSAPIRQSGWLDDSIFVHRPLEHWTNTSESYSQRAFTTGRRRYPPPSGPPPAVPGKESAIFSNKPGRINMKEFTNVTDVLAKIRLTSTREGKEALLPPAPPPRLGKVKEGIGSHFGGSYDGDYSYNSVHHSSGSSKPRSRLRRDKELRQAFTDSDSDLSSPDRLRLSDPLHRNSRKPGSGKRIRRKRAAIPVAMPKAPSLPLTPRSDPRLQLAPTDGSTKVHMISSESSEEESKNLIRQCAPRPKPKRKENETRLFTEDSYYTMPYYYGQRRVRDPTYGLLRDDESGDELASPKDKENSTLLSRLHGGPERERERDRSAQRRREKQKAKEDEKLERRKLKEEERLKKQAEKERKRRIKAGNAAKAPPTLDDVAQNE
ncbi:rho GTPase-activating protein 190-like, partial [Artemia franciscana]